MKKLVSILLSLALVLTLAAGAMAAGYPDGPITVIIPKGAGGPTDTVARLLLQYAKELDDKVDFVTVNNPGANGVIGMTQGALSKPDGYTLTMIAVELCIMPNIAAYNCPVSPTDFRGIAAPIANPSMVVVRTDSEIDDIYEYIDTMSADLRLGTAGTNTIHDLAAKAFAESFEKEFTAIPYADGESACINALIAANPEVDAIIVGPSASLKAQMDAGVLKVLGVMGASPVSIAPEAPMIKDLENGYARDITARAWAALAVPDDIDQEAYEYLVDLFTRVTESEGFQDAMNAQGIDPLLINGADCDKMVQDDFEFYKAMLADAE